MDERLHTLQSRLLRNHRGRVGSRKPRGQPRRPLHKLLLPPVPGLLQPAFARGLRFDELRAAVGIGQSFLILGALLKVPADIYNMP
eukprot:COSAG04_NODE_739_length_10697_cov_6.459332_6_plen_86_part_00